jgi:hypothetical protein
MGMVVMLARWRTTCGLNFTHGESDIDWSRLELFLPDRPYWGQREVNVIGYPEGVTTINYLPYGTDRTVQISTPINVDG